ncbi:hypothetical protein D9758_009427 [Tetrapyrgos nigripes]|uniref:Uncharacterized protein n=1 Tax=Tetrapyrgos nigripes TaxID=182062 RepID=A0A8H5D3G9_9AGAR|nr:hypothetical protein D9758_009427 [Tetrapyrgos nigripes]
MSSAHHSHRPRRPSLPPIPELRYELSYLRSIGRYVHVERNAGPSHSHASSDDAETESLYEKSRKRDVKEAAVGSTGPSEIVTVQWAPLLWVTARDQVFAPLIQGCVWAVLSVYLSPIASQLGRSVVDRRKSIQEGLGVGWLRKWFNLSTLHGLLPSAIAPVSNVSSCSSGSPPGHFAIWITAAIFNDGCLNRVLKTLPIPASMCNMQKEQITLRAIGGFEWLRHSESQMSSLQDIGRFLFTQAREHVLRFSSSRSKTSSALSSLSNTTDESESTSATQAVPIEITALPSDLWNFSMLAPGKWWYSGESPSEHASSVWNWSTPIGSLRELTNRYLTEHYGSAVNEKDKASTPLPPPQKLSDTLPPEKIKDLLEIFTSYFLPWLNINLIHSKQSQPHSSPDPNVADSILDLVCCTVASRYSSDPFISSVLPQLQVSSNEIISQVILNPQKADPLESIQSLLISSVWAPIPYGPSVDGMRDGHLLLAAALSLASEIQLDKAPDKLIALRKLQAETTDGQTTVEDDELKEAEDLTRLWVALLNTDSLLCTGTRRIPSSHGGRRRGMLAKYFEIFPLSTRILSSDVMKCRDARLHLFGRVLEGMNLGVSASLNTPGDVDGWYRQISNALEFLRITKRWVAPLPIVAEHDKFYFRMLEIVLCCCRLIVLQQSLYAARLLFTQFAECRAAPISPSNSHSKRPNAHEIMTIWGRDGRPLMEHILILLQDTDPALLGTSPDYIFHMISFSAVFLVAHKLVVWNAKGVETPGAEDMLLEKVVGLLDKTSRVRGFRTGTTAGIEHPAKRSAMLVGGVLGLWKNKEKLTHNKRQKNRNLKDGHEDMGTSARVHPSQSYTEASDVIPRTSSSESPSEYQLHAHNMHTPAEQFSTHPDLAYDLQTTPSSDLYTSLSPPTPQLPQNPQSIYHPQTGLSQTNDLYMDQTPSNYTVYTENYAADGWNESALFQDPQFWNEMWNYQAPLPSDDFTS